MTKGRTDNEGNGDDRLERNGPSVPTDRATAEISGPDDLTDELLPGLPNNLALDMIVPKLSGTDLNNLWLVSPSWRKAIRRRWVFDARIRSHSTQTFVVLSSWKERVYTFHLYPLNDNFVYNLPPLPTGNEQGLDAKLIPLDGNIYALGGVIPLDQYSWFSEEKEIGSKKLYNYASYFEQEIGSKKLYKLDVTGHKQWKQCASMQDGRVYFGAGVLDGKIYVVGGRHNGKNVHTCEVYDPKVDAWYSIADLILSRLNDQVAAVGGELFVYGGHKWRENMSVPLDSGDMAVYNPVKNEWRRVGHDSNMSRDILAGFDGFVVQGKLYNMTKCGIHVYDKDTNSWSQLLRNPVERIFLSGRETIGLDDEVVTMIYSSRRTRLVQTKGFNKNGDFAFERIQNRCLWNLDSDEYWYNFCLIQL